LKRSQITPASSIVTDNLAGVSTAGSLPVPVGPRNSLGNRRDKVSFETDVYGSHVFETLLSYGP
jgi:hypothetical protein